MPTEKIETLVIGAGQAGVAMSEHLSKCNVPHLVLERDRIAERWRTGRWDSLVANGPAWHDRFPNMEFRNAQPGDFVAKEQVADYFVDYAKQINAPIRCGVEVQSVQEMHGSRGFRVDTTDGVIEAHSIVVATGPFQKPVIPPIVAADAAVQQIHSHQYRNPDQLPEGAVLVVGAGSSGVQIADELLSSGKQVVLSVGPHDRPPRRYRGHDFVWWLGVLGKWDTTAMPKGSEHVTISVSGARGGQTIDFRRLAAQGMLLVGRTASFDNGVMHFDADLAANIAKGDANYFSVLDEADAYIERNGLDLPQDPDARKIEPEPQCISEPIHELDLANFGVTSIIWATGFATDYSWMKVAAFDEAGKPKHERGVSVVPGIYFLGLPWQSRRGSAFIWGVWHDAKYLADQIQIQRQYQEHHDGTDFFLPGDLNGA